MSFRPGGPLGGELPVPTDKSISHRAALFGAMADGVTRIEGYLDSADTRSTLAAVAALGAELGAVGRPDPFLPAASDPLPTVITVRGVGLRGAKPAAIDVGNAGTLIRLIAGWLAGQSGGEWTLDGDESIRSRPMGRVADPLRQMGAAIAGREGDLAPLRISGRQLAGIDYSSPLASAQVKSCLLLAGLLADRPTTVIEPEPSRDHTERMLAAAGARLERGPGNAVTVYPAASLEPLRLTVPGDISSAAFFIVAATLVPGSDILLCGVGVNPTRTGILDILARMGASIELVAERESGGEPVADLRVRYSAGLRGTETGGAEIPRAIDELPLVALVACFAEGQTVIRDAGDLRRKESDRIAVTVASLRALGAEIEASEDGMVVTGSPASPLRGGAIDSHGDHRIAMLGAIAGLASRDGVTVHNMEAAAVSYPNFATDLASLTAST